MADFEAPKWVVIILVYYVIMFISLTGVQAMISYLSDSQNVNIMEIDYSQQNLQAGSCEGRSNYFDVSLNYGRNLACVKIPNSDIYEICTEYSGCEWHNATNLFGFAILQPRCLSRINLTAYNLELNSSAAFCQTLNYTACEFFGCSYTSMEDLMQQNAEDSKSKNIIGSVWKTVKNVVSLQATYGLDNYDWILNFILFYCPLILLIFAGYKTLLPT